MNTPEQTRTDIGALEAGGGISTRRADSFPLDGYMSGVHLSPREVQILRLLRGGLANKQIARTIFVSQDTVKFHLKNIYRKIGAQTRVQAVCCVLANGERTRPATRAEGPQCAG